MAMETPMELPLRAMAGEERRRARLPRMAEVVADSLRSQILDGEIDVVPPLDALVRQYDVGPPAAREALRILETEGLVTVQRGNVGGAIVHAPQESKVVYMMGLVLQSRQAPLGDVLDAFIAFEPACAAACAARPDRAETVLPVLRSTLDAAAAAIGDPAAYTGLARQFHIDLVANCGNEAMRLVVGALESLWTVHVDHMARRNEQHGGFDELAARKASAREHEKLFARIEKGDVRGAELVARAHYASPEPGWGESVDTDAVVSADLLEDR